jgi:DNA-binding MarR family transcriptional regulator
MPLPSHGRPGMIARMDADTRPGTALDQLRRRAPKLSEASIDYGLLAELAGFSIKLTWILGYSLLMRGFGDSGITPQRFSMLELIGRNPGSQQIQLGSALGLSRSAATLTIDFWEERGCIERRTDQSDRRSFGIYPTERGLAELDRLRKVVLEAEAELTSSLSEGEIVELRRLLAKIHL